MRFDGSTLQGFIRRDESEMIALPDTSTFQVLPWRPKEDSVARMFCDIYKNDMTPYEGDSRYVLKKSSARPRTTDTHSITGPEIEFFFFKNSGAPKYSTVEVTTTSPRSMSPPITGGRRC